MKKCENGRYYWVDAFVTPISENGKVVGYQSTRIKPSEALKTRAQQVYDAVNQVILATSQSFPRLKSS